MTFQQLFSPLVFFLGWGIMTTCPCQGEEKDAKLEIMLSSPNTPTTSKIEVRGLPAALQKQLAGWKADDPRWRSSFSVFVGKVSQDGQPAMLGSYQFTNQSIAFVPRFGLEAGTTYCVEFKLPGQPVRQKRFTIPTAQPTPPTKITAVYPTSNKLPENLLRMYLYFSAPMSQGNSYRYLHLFNQAGEEVEYPFLELPQELWDADGKRLTVLFDPGRVKQGLKPREQFGPVLVPGGKYTFTIDQRWKDAKGQSLAKPFKRTFATTKADSIQPDPAQWKLHPPKTGSREAFAVNFEEPLDHAMLNRVLTVQDVMGKDIAGQIEIDQQETRWKFTPDKPWGPGQYSLKIRTNLEDRVGNSIARPFEVDLNQPQPKALPKFIHQTFETINPK